MFWRSRLVLAILNSLIIAYLVCNNLGSYCEAKKLNYTDENYDSHEPPKDALDLNFTFNLLGIDEISESGAYFLAQFELTISWIDDRLLSPDKINDYTFVPNERYEDFWMPQYFIQTIKDGEIFDSQLRKPICNLNQSTHQMDLQMRFKVYVHCDMDFQRYPMDTQACNMDVVPYPRNYNHNPWWMTQNESVDPNVRNMKSSAFEMTSIMFFKHEADNRHMVRVGFLFQRKLLSSIITIYFPSSLTVVISFVSFWIDATDAGARVSLSVTAQLSLVTLMFSVKQGLPAVSYLTALDIWLFVCLIFCAASMFEFSVAYLIKMAKELRAKQRSNAVTPTQIAFKIKTGRDLNDVELEPLRWYNKLEFDLDVVSQYLFSIGFALFVVIYFIIYQTSLLDYIVPTPVITN